jgi:hypothetical protein
MNRNGVLQNKFEPERRFGAFRLNITTDFRLVVGPAYGSRMVANQFRADRVSNHCAATENGQLVNFVQTPISTMGQNYRFLAIFCQKIIRKRQRSGEK